MASITVDDAQMHRLSTLAEERNTSRDALLSLAISDFLAREEARQRPERVDMLHTELDSDVEATQEEARLAAARRSNIRRINRLNQEEGDTSW